MEAKSCLDVQYIHTGRMEYDSRIFSHSEFCEHRGAKDIDTLSRRKFRSGRNIESFVS